MTWFPMPSPGLAALAVAFVLGSADLKPTIASFELINNGSFEAGFAGWTRQDFLASEGTFFLQSGLTSPVNLDPVPAPPVGLFAAMSDAQGPGSHVLYQDFVVPTISEPVILQFRLFIGNRATNPTSPNQPLFASPSTLDWTTPTLNQQARVDLLRGGSDPFSVSASDVLLNVFQTQPGNNFGPGYIWFSFNITSLLASQAGQTIRLRFAEVDNIGPFQLGVDGVSLASVPEPSSWALCLIGAILGFAGYKRRVLRPGLLILPTGSLGDRSPS